MMSASSLVDSAAQSTTWISELQSGRGDISIPDGGVVVDKSVVIRQSRRILGQGESLKFTGAGQLVFEPSLNTERLELQDSQIIWERDFNFPGASAAFELRKGEIAISRNTFYVDAQPAAGIESQTDFAPAGYLLQAGTATSAPTKLDVSDNQFTNAKRYAAGVLKLFGAQTVPSLNLADNTMKSFHNPIVIAKAPNGKFINNSLDQNSGDNLVVTGSDGIIILQNDFRFAGVGHGGDGITLADLAQASVAENVIFDTAGMGIQLSGSVSSTALVKNFVHGSAGAAISVGTATSTSQSFSALTLDDNVLVQNTGWAVDARNVRGLVLRENVLHLNHLESGGFQHQFVGVTEIVDERNLWDVAQTPYDVAPPAMFGTNASTYRFDVGMVINEPETQLTPLVTASLSVFEPTGTTAAYNTWITDLESGTGDIVIPASGIVLDRAVTIRNARRIIGNGHTLKFSGTGTITVNMTNSSATFEMSNVTMIWQRSLETYGAANAITVFRGGLNFHDNRVYTLITPKSTFYNDPAIGLEATRDRIAENPTPAFVFDIELPANVVGVLNLERNSFENERWYAAGLLFTSATSRFSSTVVRDNTIKYFHGVLYLNGIDNGVVEGNRLHRNSFGNLVIRNAANVVVRRNRLEFPGNGSAGDGATLGAISSLLFEHNLITNGSCYGTWVIDSAANSTFRDNVYHGGITTAIRLDAPTNPALIHDLTIQHNLFTHNTSWGISGNGAQSLTIKDNVFHGNQTDAWKLQHHVTNFQSVVATGNLLGIDYEYAATPTAISADVSPYWMLSLGTDLLQVGDDWTLLGTDANDLMRLTASDPIQIQFNGDVRSIPVVAGRTRIRFTAGGGKDTSIVDADATVERATLTNGRAYLGGSRYTLDLETEVNTIYGKSASFAFLNDTTGKGKYYGSPNYVRLSGTDFENYAQGFGGTLAYSGVAGDSAVMDDSAGVDSYLLGSSANCLVGSTFQHSLLGFTRVTARSDVGGSDAATFYDGPLDTVQLTSTGGRLQSSTTLVTITNVERLATQVFSSGVGSPPPYDQCMNYGTLRVPPTLIQGSLWEDGNADGARSGVEAGLNGRTVFLDADADGVLDASEPTTTTTSDGSFLFSGVGPGTYQVNQVLPTGWLAASTPQSISVLPGLIISNLTLASRRPVWIDGTTAYVAGTANDDEFSFAADASGYHIDLNGTRFDSSLTGVTRLNFQGNGGHDHVVLNGTSGDDQATIRDRQVALALSGLQVNAYDASSVDLKDGGSGNDTAMLYDSPGDDLFTGSAESSQFVVGASANNLVGFETIRVYGTAGGQDQATLADSTGDDDLVSTSQYSRLLSSRFYHYVQGFDSVVVRATAGGTDKAAFYDSSGNDVFVGSPDSNRLSGTGFDSQAIGFDSVRVYASSGGNDSATLADSPGDDDLIATSTYARLTGVGYYQYLVGFDAVSVDATAGGTDTAGLYDSSGDDRFLGAAKSSRLSGNTFNNLATGFDTVRVYATAGGIDRATAVDSAGNDDLSSTPSYSRLMGTDYYQYLQGFDAVEFLATSGGSDTASLYDSTGNDQFTASQEWSRLSGTGFNTKVVGFDTVRAYATAGGNDTASLADTTGTDDVIATLEYTRLLGSGLYIYVQAFDTVNVASTHGGTDLITLSDSPGNDELVGTPTELRFTGNNATVLASGFPRVAAYIKAGGTDRLTLTDSSGDDEFLSTPTANVFAGTGFAYYTEGFEECIVTASVGTDLGTIQALKKSETIVRTQSEVTITRQAGFIKLIAFDRVQTREGSASSIDAIMSQDLSWI